MSRAEIELLRALYADWARGGRGKTSGAPLDEPAANTWRFRDGRAMRLTLYANRETALRDAGIPPSRG
jgi:ketosteroid isomerase-like protein